MGEKVKSITVDESAGGKYPVVTIIRTLTGGETATWKYTPSENGYDEEITGKANAVRKERPFNLEAEKLEGEFFDAFERAQEVIYISPSGEKITAISYSGRTSGRDINANLASLAVIEALNSVNAPPSVEGVVTTSPDSIVTVPASIAEDYDHLAYKNRVESYKKNADANQAVINSNESELLGALVIESRKELLLDGILDQADKDRLTRIGQEFNTATERKMAGVGELSKEELGRLLPSASLESINRALERIRPAESSEKQ